MCTGNTLTGTLAKPFVYWKPFNGYFWQNSEDPYEMQRNAAINQGLHCLRRLKLTSETENYQNLEKSACDPFKSTQWAVPYEFNQYVRNNAPVHKELSEY